MIDRAKTISKLELIRCNSEWNEDFNKALDHAIKILRQTDSEDCVSRQAVLDLLAYWVYEYEYDEVAELVKNLPPVTPTVEDMGEVSDGYHTFNQLYHQRAVLFATIVNQNKDKAWKSWKHEDGQFCFDKGGEWFIVGIDTPEGSYTYHYEKKYWDMFDCEELDRGKHWDGHTEDDVTRLLSLPPVEPELPKGEWVGFAECSVCGKQAGDFIEGDEHWVMYLPNYCPNCGAKMKGGTENE